MSKKDSISVIQCEEKAAAAQIAKVQEDIKSDQNNLEQEQSEKFTRLKDILSAEMAAIATKTQEKAQAFKDKIGGEIAEELTALEESAQQRVSSAADFVLKKFNQDVDK